MVGAYTQWKRDVCGKVVHIRSIAHLKNVNVGHSWLGVSVTRALSGKKISEDM